MLGAQVVCDLELEKLCSVVPTHLGVGAKCFHEQLVSPTADVAELRGKQRILKALRRGAGVSISEKLKSLADAAKTFEAWTKESDKLAEESICQIFYKKDSPGAFLNSNTRYLDFVLFWRTLLLPAFALLAPLIGVILPYFLFKYLGAQMEVPEYIEHVRTVILRQITIPSVLRARGESDRVGGALQSLFIGFTLVMFISGLWNQIQAAIHLRSVFGSLKDRGGAIAELVGGASAIHTILKEDKYAAVYAPLLQEGAAAIEEAKDFADRPAIACAGLYWNGRPIDRVLRWLGTVDAYVAVSSLKGICFPALRSGTALLAVKGVRHPLLPECVPNDYNSASHTILTGPNRGGKSTFCKSLGIAVITAQSWGIAWSDKMALVPFSGIHTALETVGRLGFNSTFEAEISFAKNVLDTAADGPLFVMMDEIFHSTNAVDGVAASKVFLQRLYAKPRCISLISTHYRELATLFEGKAAALQMITGGDEDALVYSYKIGPGTSDKSSVMELLREKGLLLPGAKAAAEADEKKSSQPNQNE
jgi:hypothetical protein